MDFGIITIGVGIAGSLLGFAWKEPRIYLRLQHKLQSIVVLSWALGMGFVGGAYFTAQTLSAKLPTLPKDPAAIEGAKHILSGLSWLNDTSIAISSVTIALLLLETGATLLAKEIVRQRLIEANEVAIKQAHESNGD